MAFAFLADHAAVPPDGKLYVLGGGITAVRLPQLPGRASFVVVGGFRFSPADSHSVHVVELRLVDADGGLVLPPATLQFQSAQVIPPDQDEITVSTVSHMAPMFGEAGRYRIEYWYSGRLLAYLGLTVAEQAGGGPAAQLPGSAAGPQPPR